MIPGLPQQLQNPIIPSMCCLALSSLVLSVWKDATCDKMGSNKESCQSVLEYAMPAGFIMSCLLVAYIVFTMVSGQGMRGGYGGGGMYGMM